jgi:hypothetical protein
VSDLRAGDIKTSMLTNRNGEPLAFFVRYPGDDQDFRTTATWARNVSQLNPNWAYLFISPDLEVTRLDDVGQQVEPKDLARILRNDPELRRLLTVRSKHIVLATLQGNLRASITDFSQGMLDGGYSRGIMHPRGPLRLKPNGEIEIGPEGVDKFDPPRPRPDDVLIEPLHNDLLGFYGHVLPRDLFDNALRNNFEQKFSPLAQRVYMRQISVSSGPNSAPESGFVAALMPKSGFDRNDPTQTQWYIKGHGGSEGFQFSLRTDQLFHMGDENHAPGDEFAKLILLSEVFRRTGPKTTSMVRLLSCSVNSSEDYKTATSALKLRDSWRTEQNSSTDVSGGTDVILAGMADGIIKIVNGGVIVPARGAGEAIDYSAVVYLNDLAAVQIPSMQTNFSRDSANNVTITAGDAENIRATVRRVVRAAAWRSKIGELLPEMGINVRIDSSQPADGGLERATLVQDIVRKEIAAESRRLVEHGLKIDSKQIRVHLHTSAAPPGLAGSGVLHPVALVTKLPESQALTQAEAALNYLWSVGTHRDYSAHQKVLDAFAALEP